MTVFREKLQAAMALAQEGRDAEAVEIIDLALTQALAQNETRWVSLLARNAAIVCEHQGNLQQARDYLLRGLEHDPHDARMSYSLATILLKLGEKAGSESYFAKCKEDAIQQGDKELLELLSKLPDSDHGC